MAEIPKSSEPDQSPAGSTQRREKLANNLIGGAIIFGVVLVLWIAFGAVLIFNAGSLDDLWQSFRDQPLLVQVIGWIVLLPWLIGLWVWETTWPLVARVVVVAGLAVATIFMFFPRGR